MHTHDRQSYIFRTSCGIVERERNTSGNQIVNVIRLIIKFTA